MVRAFFLAIGITCLLLGAQCMVVERAVFASRGPEPPAGAYGNNFATTPQRREFTLPEWAPWGFLAGGAVVIIYSFTIPRRILG